MDINKAIENIDKGCLAYRMSWRNECIFKEFSHSVHNSTLDSEIMLPTVLKNICKENDINLNYRNLIFKIDLDSGIVEPYFPNDDDIEGEDWIKVGNHTIDDIKIGFEELLKSVFNE